MLTLARPVSHVLDEQALEDSFSFEGLRSQTICPGREWGERCFTLLCFTFIEQDILIIMNLVMSR